MGCVGVSADLGFTAPALDAASLCGFKFPPTIVFKFGFSLPAFLFTLPKIPFPWLSLNCDLAKPVSLGWGGGRMPQFDTSAFDDCAPD
jgi:hypothetical protein